MSRTGNRAHYYKKNKVYYYDVISICDDDLERVCGNAVAQQLRLGDHTRLIALDLTTELERLGWEDVFRQVVKRHLANKRDSYEQAVHYMNELLGDKIERINQGPGTLDDSDGSLGNAYAQAVIQDLTEACQALVDGMAALENNLKHGGKDLADCRTAQVRARVVLDKIRLLT